MQWPYKTASMVKTDSTESYNWYNEFRAGWKKYTEATQYIVLNIEARNVAFLSPPANLTDFVPANAVPVLIAFKLRTSDTNPTLACYINPGSAIPTDAQAAIAWADTSQSTWVCDVPQNNTDFPCGTDETAKIRTILTNGAFFAASARWEIGSGSEYLRYIETEITYLDPNKAPVISVTEPADLVYRLITDPLTVSWAYAQEADSPQTSYTIQASYDDGATWETVASETSAAHTHTFPADTFGTGTLRLRVTASSAYADSAPAEVRVYMRANPATSDVSCDGNPHPTVSWTGADQTAYQVRFGDWDSGAVFGSASSMTIPRIFSAGVYPVTVRTQTSNGDWSSWSNTLWVEITNSDPGLTGTLTAAMSGGAALVSWTESPGAAGYVLLRDGEPIYAGTDTYFRDDAAAGTVTWTLRCVSAAGYYSDADTVTWTLPLRCDMLRPMDDDTADWIAIRYSLDRRSRSYDRQLGTSFRYYAGREKPVAVSTGESTRTMRTTAAFKSRAQAEAILALAGRPVLYKDVTGGVIIGILNPAGYDAERVFSVDLSITEIAWPADIDSGVEAIFTAAATHIRAIDPVTETRVKCTINSSGNWASPTTSSIAWMLEVPEGSTHLRIHTGRSGNIMAWLTSGTVKTSGKPDYCEGYSNRITIGSSTPQPMELPADCTFVYVAIRYSSGWTIPRLAQFEGSYV